jgi:hypothetical protein
LLLFLATLIRTEADAEALAGLSFFHPPERVLPLLRAVAQAGVRDLIARRHKLTGKPARRLLRVVSEDRPQLD